MYYYCWLLNQFDLIDDIKYYIKTFMLFKIIKPPSYDTLKLNYKNKQYHDNGVVIKEMYDLTPLNFFDEREKIYIATCINIKNKYITEIQFSYFVEGTLLDYDFYVDFEASYINPKHIYLKQSVLMCMFDHDFNQHFNITSFDQDGIYSIEEDFTLIYDPFN
jgi:hypothetical protein